MTRSSNHRLLWELRKYKHSFVLISSVHVDQTQGRMSPWMWTQSFRGWKGECFLTKITRVVVPSGRMNGDNVAILWTLKISELASIFSFISLDSLLAWILKTVIIFFSLHSNFSIIPTGFQIILPLSLTPQVYALLCLPKCCFPCSN